jgi:hypothetical protein
MTEENKAETPSDDDILSSITQGFAALGAESTPVEEGDSGEADDTQEAEQETDDNGESNAADNDAPEIADKPKGRRAQKEYERAEHERQARIALEAELAAMKAQLANLTDIKTLLEPKKEAAPTGIDAELQQYGIDPRGFEEVYDESGNLELSVTAQKKLALNEAKTTTLVTQMQQQATLGQTAQAIEATVAAVGQTTPEIAEMLNNAVTLLVSSQAFILQENNPKLTEEQASTAAYQSVMQDIARRAKQSGKHPAMIAAEMGDRMANKLGVPLVKEKPLQATKKSSNINIEHAKRLQAQAGAAHIKVAPTKQATESGLSSGFRDYLKSEFA